MENSKIVAYIFLFVVGFFILAFGYILGFNTQIPASLGETIFVALIQVNGTLIGFFGIFTIFQLQEFSKSISLVTEKSLENIRERELHKCKIEDNKEHNKVDTLIKREHKVYKNAVESFLDWGYETKKDKSDFSIVTVSSIVFFVLSISFSVVGLRNIGTETVEANWVIWSFIFLSFGIVIELITMISLPPKPRKKPDDTEPENE